MRMLNKILKIILDLLDVKMRTLKYTFTMTVQSFKSFCQTGVKNDATMPIS
jgi:hypothetical protein